VEEIQKTVNNTSSGVADLCAAQEEEDHRSIAEWLTPINYAVQQNDFFNRRQEGTGNWFLESEEFQLWLTQPREYPTLFCPGIPGAGKTMITSIVIAYLQTHFQTDPKVGIAYIFFSFQQQDKQNPNDLVASLLRQLAHGHGLQPVKELYKKHQDNGTHASLKDLLATLHAVVTSYSRVIILIDALDECQVHDSREMFLQELFSLQKKAGRTMNIFATSRYGQPIEEFFENSLKRNIYADEADVRRYIDDKLQRFRSWVAKNDSLKEMIKETLAKAVDGM
jgi:hypothetical protein